ncbi:MAG: ribonuclease P protein component [bacterium]
MSEEGRLRASGEFRLVYAKGRRYDSHSFTAFIYAGRSTDHRLGVTASSKAVGCAVDRNRAKRLLREMFRLNNGQLDILTVKYDWVLNAKRSLLTSNVENRFSEFKKIVQQIAKTDNSGI